jgi:ribonucleoside-triphosphate reductase (formate)
VKPVVIKRDGCRVPFNTQRIKEAILGAAQSVDEVDVEAMNEAYAASVADGVLSQFLS